MKHISVKQTCTP